PAARRRGYRRAGGAIVVVAAVALGIALSPIGSDRTRPPPRIEAPAKVTVMAAPQPSAVRPPPAAPPLPPAPPAAPAAEVPPAPLAPSSPATTAPVPAARLARHRVRPPTARAPTAAGAQSPGPDTLYSR